MIRLSGTHGNDRIRSGGQRFADQELKLSQLVSAATQAVQIVSLDVNIDAAEMPT
jgi:hypothetical protein